MKKLIIGLLFLALMATSSFAAITVSGRTKTMDTWIVYGTYTAASSSGITKALGLKILSAVVSSTAVAEVPATSFSGSTLTIKSTSSGAGQWIAICK